MNCSLLHLSLLVGVLLIWRAAVVVEAQCSVTKDWEPVDPSDYDQTYSPITDEAARPVGYAVGHFLFMTDSAPCITVQGTTARYVQVQVVSAQLYTICIRSNDGGTTACTEADGRILLCKKFSQAGGNFTIFEFYCNDECATQESDVSFWYRFTVSPPIVSDADDFWCDETDARVPSDLVTVTFVPTTSPKPSDGNSATKPSFTSIMGLLPFLIFSILIFIM